tara:strand:+ start:660 stop:2318 length:1659 start_codon:yes stop_codon:yes gene_type:complete
MGLLNGVDRVYYEGEDLGNYQFTSLDDIISQFQVAYVGEDKIISKIKRADVAFHAQRALQELSFDTLKSVKAQEIVLPPTLSMILPRDYVNYTKVSTVDSSGIKHPLYPTKDTSNPFSVKQKGTGAYSFDNSGELVKNHTFNESINGTWEYTPASPAASASWTNASEQDALQQYFARYKYDKIGTQSGDTTFPWNDLQAGKLNFESYPHKKFGGTAAGWAREYGAWQKIDVSNLFFIDLEVNGQSAAQIKDNVDIACDFGELRVGLSSVDPEEVAISQGTVARNSLPINVRLATGSGAGNFSIHRAENYDLGYLEWNDGTSSWKHLRDVDVSEYDYIWVWVQSFSPWTSYSITEFTTEPGDDPGAPNSSVFGNSGSVNRVGAVKINSAEPDNMLREANADKSSTARNNYNSSTPSENTNDNYEDDTYWPASGSRYGIDTTRAQVNGSFYVDNRMGKINFSSNISGKTVILDYISDSLGTDEEMQVHKFAEEAMYKCIAYAILSTRANTQEYIVQRFKKERFAAMRTAKLRMSNIKIEELTQILRGKSKWIKH